MKPSTTLLLASLSLSSVGAQPHGHGHQHAHKRDNQVVWVTDWDYVTETVEYTTTIWVSSGYVAPSSATPVPAQFFQGQDSSSSVAAAAASSPTTSSSVYVAPTPAYVAPVESSSSTTPAPGEESTPAPVPESTSAPAAESTPAPVPESTPAPAVEPAPAPVVESTPAPVVESTPAPATVAETTPAPVAESTSTPAAVAVAAPATTSASSASSGSSGGVCSSGSPCEGDITYYEAGLGACGWTNDGDTENVVALPFGLMGTQSNGNPYCGLTITITCTATGKTTTAKVVDKCMGCTGYAIDLSNAAFLDLDDLAVGRTSATWHFN